MYLPTHRRIANLPSNGMANHKPNKVYLGALATALGTLGVGLAGIGLAAPAIADGTTIEIKQDTPFTETFGTGGREVLRGDQPGTTYVSDLGQSYTASNYWASVAHCNGIILSFTTALNNGTDCSAYNVAFPPWDEQGQEQKSIRVKAAALGLLGNQVYGGEYKDAMALDATVVDDQPLPSQNRALSTNTTAGIERGGAPYWGGYCSYAGCPNWFISSSAEAGGSYPMAMQVMIASERPIKPEAGSAFLELSVDYAATACANKQNLIDDKNAGRGNPNPHLIFQWLSAPPDKANNWLANDPNHPGGNIVQTSAPVDICGNDLADSPTRFASTPICAVSTNFTAPTGVSTGISQYKIDGEDVWAVTAKSPIAQMFSAEDIGNTGLWYRILNTTNEQNGNDGALDNVKVTVATPTIHKSFSDEYGNPSKGIVPGQVTYIQFTIKNSEDNAEKSGWSITDTLDPGLRVAIDSTDANGVTYKVKTDCGTPSPPNPGMVVSGGKSGDRDTIVIKNGTIGAGMSECFIWVPVVADMPDPDNPGSTVGEHYQNCVIPPVGNDGGYLGGGNAIEIDPDDECATIEVVEPQLPSITKPTLCADGQMWVSGKCYIPTPPDTTTPKVCAPDQDLVEIDGVLVCAGHVPPSLGSPPPVCAPGLIVIEVEGALTCGNMPPSAPVPPPVCSAGEIVIEIDGVLTCGNVPPAVPVPPLICSETEIVVEVDGVLKCGHMPPAAPPLPICADGEIFVLVDGVLKCGHMPPSLGMPPICTAGQIVVLVDGVLTCGNEPPSIELPGCPVGTEFIVTEAGIVCGSLVPPTEIPKWGVPIAPHIPSLPVSPLPVFPGDPNRPVTPPQYPGFCPEEPNITLPIVFPPPQTPPTTLPAQLTDTGISELVMFEALAVSFAGLVVINWRRTCRN